MEDNPKKKYNPPRLRVINLETKEVLMGACKTQGYHNAVTGPHCGLVGNHGPCMDDGS